GPVKPVKSKNQVPLSGMLYFNHKPSAVAINHSATFQQTPLLKTVSQNLFDKIQFTKFTMFKMTIYASKLQLTRIR
ncbi:hypothetical protein, partial [Klebsiella pneumoniae]|uniref:hypothetical protein n=1 Tax=Klebsiella pneumoniae TaxID=573 RepID=UPI0040556344